MSAAVISAARRPLAPSEVPMDPAVGLAARRWGPSFILCAVGKAGVKVQAASISWTGCSDLRVTLAKVGPMPGSCAPLPLVA